MQNTESQGGPGISLREATESAAPVRIFHRVLDWMTSERFQLLNITDRIQGVVRRSGIREGLVHIQSLHTTTALLINEWQAALLEDIKRVLEELVVRDRPWRHNDPAFSDCDRGNADAHLRGMLLGQSLCLQVRNAAVLLGAWQSIILAELDGPRTRQVAVQVLGL
ncbi:MAG: secondary thiamine-phosphate synthase enzyme YjbQ [Bryobacterales bacterium]|nr:secondary thiamine-phosphate synthase enzyme YjbQ [Bryobacteraceae bacterium]MDW8131587.1 secondary thiamine-phosphate synthase enzyme YjbQ [Bryobacterales bacterium]